MVVDDRHQQRSLIRFMLLSLGAAVATIVLKLLAAAITGSVGLLSDAMESGVNRCVVLLECRRVLLEAASDLGLDRLAQHVDEFVGSSGVESLFRRRYYRPDVEAGRPGLAPPQPFSLLRV